MCCSAAFAVAHTSIKIIPRLCSEEGGALG